VWSSDENFFCTKTTAGEFNCPDLFINVWDERYTEGDGWHWRFFVPADMDGLIGLFPSEDDFINELSAFFEK
jgi:putative alpha-1,2-mannosidase